MTAHMHRVFVVLLYAGLVFAMVQFAREISQSAEAAVVPQEVIITCRGRITAIGAPLGERNVEITCTVR